MTNTTKTGFFRSALNSMYDARARQATRYVNGALLMLDDATLTAALLARLLHHAHIVQVTGDSNVAGSLRRSKPCS